MTSSGTVRPLSISAHAWRPASRKTCTHADLLGSDIELKMLSNTTLSRWQQYVQRPLCRFSSSIWYYTSRAVQPGGECFIFEMKIRHVNTCKACTQQAKS